MHMHERLKWLNLQFTVVTLRSFPLNWDWDGISLPVSRILILVKELMISLYYNKDLLIIHHHKAGPK